MRSQIGAIEMLDCRDVEGSWPLLIAVVGPLGRLTVPTIGVAHRGEDALVEAIVSRVVPGVCAGEIRLRDLVATRIEQRSPIGIDVPALLVPGMIQSEQMTDLVEQRDV